MKSILIGAVCALLVCCAAYPGCAHAWWNDEWKLRQRITVHVPPSASSGKQVLKDVPILVRLHTANFPFLDAREDGADLRFVAADDKTPLKFHIEAYDPTNELASVWVRIPELDLESAGASIWVYFGNAKAPPASDPAGTLDSATTLVLHFSERAGPPKDATSAAHQVTPSGAVQSLPDGFIDGAVRLGANASLEIPDARDLDTQPPGVTVSGWVRVGEPADRAVIAAWPRDGSGLWIGLDRGRLTARYSGTQVQARSAVQPSGWHAFTVTIGDELALYLDGIPQGGAAVSPAMLQAPLVIGGAGFAGDLDEIVIAASVRTPGWVRTVHAAQIDSGSMLEMGEPEQRGAAGRTYLAILLAAVTTDGWVVIGVLMAMLALSLGVLLTKARALMTAGSANRRFLIQFKGRTDELLDPESLGLGAGPCPDAPLCRLWQLALRELKGRFDKYERSGRPRMLTQPSLSAIKAALDAGLVLESDRLNDHMVLLTIAISGGPFLGLLGTVTGVMITFAAIAAVGEVNINSIAPGIAAALVATVAGLAVAIPSLFGYNYLANRIRRMTSEMAVFSDELVTRLAEAYSD